MSIEDFSLLVVVSIPIIFIIGLMISIITDNSQIKPRHDKN